VYGVGLTDDQRVIVDDQTPLDDPIALPALAIPATIPNLDYERIPRRGSSRRRRRQIAAAAILVAVMIVVVMVATNQLTQPGAASITPITSPSPATASTPPGTVATEPYASATHESPSADIKSDPPSVAEWGPLAVADIDEGRKETASGRLALVDGCVMLRTDDGLHLLVWPQDRTRWDDEQQAVVFLDEPDQEEVLVMGSVVHFGAGGAGPPEAEQTVQETLGAVDWASPPDPGCDPDGVRFIGSVWIDYEPPVELPTPPLSAQPTGSEMLQLTVALDRAALGSEHALQIRLDDDTIVDGAFARGESIRTVVYHYDLDLEPGTHLLEAVGTSGQVLAEVRIDTAKHEVVVLNVLADGALEWDRYTEKVLFPS